LYQLQRTSVKLHLTGQPLVRLSADKQTVGQTDTFVGAHCFLILFWFILSRCQS